MLRQGLRCPSCARCRARRREVYCFSQRPCLVRKKDIEYASAAGDAPRKRGEAGFGNKDLANGRMAKSRVDKLRRISRIRLPRRALGTRQGSVTARSEEHTSELQSRPHLVCRLLLEKKNNI